MGLLFCLSELQRGLDCEAVAGVAEIQNAAVLFRDGAHLRKAKAVAVLVGLGDPEPPLFVQGQLTRVAVFAPDGKIPLGDLDRARYLPRLVGALLGRLAV